MIYYVFFGLACYLQNPRYQQCCCVTKWVKKMNTYYLGHMKPDFTPLVVLMLCVVLSLLHGCTQMDSLKSPAKSAQKQFGLVGGKGNPVAHQGAETVLYAASQDCSHAANYLAPLNYRVDKPLVLPASETAPSAMVELLYSRDLPLSPGDLLEISLESGEGFSGRYVVASNGYISIPLLSPILAQGIGVKALGEKIELALVRGNVFRAGTLAINVQILQLADIEVSVSGAVFEAGWPRAGGAPAGSSIPTRRSGCHRTATHNGAA